MVISRSLSGKTYCNTLQHTAMRRNLLQHNATPRSTATTEGALSSGNTRQRTATYSSTLQHPAATPCNTLLQHTAAHCCNTLQHCN